jgi:hypothetical protein
MVVGGGKLVFEVTSPPTGGADIKVQVAFPKVFKPLSFRTHLSGTDARAGALLYPAAFLGTGPGAAARLRANGLDVSVDEASLPTCHFGPQLCSRLANAVAKSIAATLEIASPDEVPGFEAGTQALGVACVALPADLAPESSFDCTSDHVNVHVANLGTAPAPASTTHVDFANGGSVDMATPVIGVGGSTTVTFAIPASCFVSNKCGFSITVDSANAVIESNESNNSISKVCDIG